MQQLTAAASEAQQTARVELLHDQLCVYIGEARKWCVWLLLHAE
jgi:hypothetical protein